MTLDGLSQRWEVRCLSVLLAVLLWLAVEAERSSDLSLSVPVTLEHLPPGLSVVGAPPVLRLTVYGPRIRLWGVRLRGVSCPLDLAGLGPGSTSYNPESSLRLDHELKVTRLYPSPLTVTLAPQARP